MSNAVSARPVSLYPQQQPQQPQPSPPPQQPQPQQFIIAEPVPVGLPTVVAPPPVASCSPGPGRFAPHYKFRLAGILGRLLIVVGTFAMVGFALEAIALSVFYFRRSILPASTMTQHCGFWCGLLIIACGAIAIEANETVNRIDSMFFASFIGSVISLVFSIVLLAMPAKGVDDSSGWDTGSTYSGGYTGDTHWYQRSYNDDTDSGLKILRAAYGLMIVCGMAGMALSVVIVVLFAKAIIQSGYIRLNISTQVSRPDQPQQARRY